jgi:carboxyl-terminal processing protease
MDNKTPQKTRVGDTIKEWASFLGLGVVFGVLLYVSGCSGSLFGDPANEPHFARFQAVYFDKVSNPDDTAQLDNFKDAFRRIQSDYIYNVPPDNLVTAAIRGVDELEGDPYSIAAPKLIEAALDEMTSSLDPHSAYLNPEELREMRLSNKGEFGGLGIEVMMEGDAIKVISPIEDTPAFRAGIKSEDLITHLDGVPVKGHKLRWAVRIMRGKPGTKISLRIMRGNETPFDVSIVRAVVKTKAVRWRLEGDVGYIRVSRFNRKVEEGIEDALESIHDQLDGRLAGIVLDLRNNPGGLLDQSVVLSDAFLNDGIIVSIKGREGRRQESYEADFGDLAKGVPMVVLINGGSASASEIVASALQDNGRAILMGVPSFGKGSVQTVSPLSYEGALRLTTALYYSPSGRAIQARGVDPDIVILSEEKEDEKGEPRKKEADLPGALALDVAPGLSAIGAGHRENIEIKEKECRPAGEKEDRTLGCALDFLHADSKASFLASLGVRYPL